MVFPSVSSDRPLATASDTVSATPAFGSTTLTGWGGEISRRVRIDQRERDLQPGAQAIGRGHGDVGELAVEDPLHAADRNPADEGEGCHRLLVASEIFAHVEDQRLDRQALADR